MYVGVPTEAPPPPSRGAGEPPTRHVDLWVQVLDILEKIGSEVQWLGINLGYVSLEEAFAPALQKALGRAHSMQHWNLTLKE